MTNIAVYRLKIASLLALLIVAFNCNVANSISAQPATGLVIKQTSIWSGEFLIYTSSFASKICDLGHSITYIVHNTQNKICVLNEKSKSYCLIDIKEWQEPFSVGTFLRKQQFTDLHFQK